MSNYLSWHLMKSSKSGSLLELIEWDMIEEKLFVTLSNHCQRLVMVYVMEDCLIIENLNGIAETVLNAMLLY